MHTGSTAVVLRFPDGGVDTESMKCSIVIQLLCGEIRYVVAGGGSTKEGLLVELEVLEAVTKKLRGEIGKQCYN